MSTIDRTELVRSAFEAMVPEFGKPNRWPIHYQGPEDSTLRVGTHDDPVNDEIHPVFALGHHFRSHDNSERGYTGNPYRGDHHSIPAFIGTREEIAIFETSFHKGQAFIEVVTFPEADRDSPLYRAALSLLEAEETR